MFVILDHTPSFCSETTSKVWIITQKEKPSLLRSQQRGSFLFHCLHSFLLGSSLQSQVLHNNNLQKHMEFAFFNLCWNLMLASGHKIMLLSQQIWQDTLKVSFGARVCIGRSCTSSLLSCRDASGLSRSFHRRRQGISRAHEPSYPVAPSS